MKLLSRCVLFGSPVAIGIALLAGGHAWAGGILVASLVLFGVLALNSVMVTVLPLLGLLA